MHTDSIITYDKIRAEYFLNNVNSSIAMQNVSTQFKTVENLDLVWERLVYLQINFH